MPLTIQDRAEIRVAISQWREAAKSSTNTHQSVQTCLKAARSLELELETGVAHCVCHLSKLKDCPNQSQNKR